MIKRKLARLSSISASTDFSKAQGDPRLVRRVRHSLDALEKRPSQSFPKVFGNEAGSEGFYRLLRNQSLEWPALLAPHAEASAARARAFSRVLCIHDTTKFEFNCESEREGLGWVSKSKRKTRFGFFAHVGLLATDHETPIPLGVVSAELWTRIGAPAGKKNRKAREKADNRESLRWGRGVDASRGLSIQSSVVHLMDCEGDIFAVFASIQKANERFVIRMRQNRRVDDKRGATAHEILFSLDGMCTREVPLSSRRKPAGPRSAKTHPARKKRQATLTFSATSMIIKRPTQLRDHKDCAEFKINIVHVRELRPPEGETAVDWKLLTTEPIVSEEAVLDIVDMYRKRWLIEEFFQAIKTGCSFEKRQLESFHTLAKALAVTLPVAWKLLLLRAMGREYPEQPATVVLSEDQIELLRRIAKRPVPPNPTAYDILWALAGMGGHLRQNGPPGWKTLAAGLQVLLAAEQGWLAAKRCDQ